ncbi:hypothetical protein PVK06_039545 [Gossypium arboreum]|uniref:Uncharacterized protein n=1 Tax=Gossypium arboreum TaxID=29729 RepID=A0ABR0N373_GOSAR|nr:hypothetical protein PVK06_039545 [Gossypium arboreum]
MRRGIPVNKEYPFDLKIERTLRRRQKELQNMARNGNDPSFNCNLNGQGANPHVWEGVGDAKPVKTNPANEENAPKALEEEPEKTKFVSIKTNHGDKEEANPSVAPLVDSTAAIPPLSTELMTEHDRKINQIINELTKFDNENEDVPLNLLKRQMRYKISARKTTCCN